MLIFLNPFNTVFHIRCINIHAKQLIIILQNLVCTSSHKNGMDLPVPGASLSLSAHETSSPESSGVFYPAILLTSLLRLHKRRLVLPLKFIDDFLADSMPLCFLQQKLTVVTGNSHFFWKQSCNVSSTASILSADRDCFHRAPLLSAHLPEKWIVIFLSIW